MDITFVDRAKKNTFDQVSQSTYKSVQVLRFVAAALVIITHITLYYNDKIAMTGRDGYWHKGMIGVDIFFVISGFVMGVSGHKFLTEASGWWSFLKRRIIRVVPLYWFATSLKIIAAITFPKLAAHSYLAISYLISCYLFIPSPNADGEMLPILTVGWTLNYEMFFYIVFSLAIFLRAKPLVFVSLVFFTLICIAQFKQSNWWGYTSMFWPLIFEFVLGMIIAKYVNVLRTVRIQYAWFILALTLGYVFFQGNINLDYRYLYWGVPAFLIVLSSVILEGKIGLYINEKLILLGDSSYSLYLFHPFIVPICFVAFKKCGVDDVLSIIISSLLICIIGGVMAYLYVEKPMLRIMRKFA